MEAPATAYFGDEGLAFVCYSHRDIEAVYPDIIAMQAREINVWYDEGISAGSPWRAEIASAIKQSYKFLFFISNSSLLSPHCLSELDFALNNDIDIVPIYLEDVDLPAELHLSLDRIQALFRNKDSNYERHLMIALEGRKRIENSNLASSKFMPKNQKFSQKSRKQKLFMVMSIFTLLALSSVFFLNQHWMVDPQQANKLSTPTTIAASNDALEAYDLYQAGNAYLLRWDKEGHIVKAIEAFSKAIELKPDFALSYSRLAEALRIRYALTRNKQFLQQASENALKGLSISPNLAPVHISLSRVNLTQGNIAIAYASAEKALTVDPSSSEANQAMALILQKQGRSDDAVRFFEKAISLSPENLVILDSFANFMFDIGKLETAAMLWEKLLTIAPDHFAALINLGTAMANLNNQEKAIALNLKAIDIRPSYMAYSNLGVAFTKKGLYDKAVDAYKNALDIDDTDWLVWGNLGFSYDELGKKNEANNAISKAIELAEKAREHNARDIWANSDLALYYAYTGQTDFAQKRINTALALAPDSGEIYIIAAQMYIRIGENIKASQYIQQAIDIDYPIEEIRAVKELEGLLVSKN